MEITQIKHGNLRLKAKNVTVLLDKTVSIGAQNKAFEISEPGEYEVEGVSVFGYSLAEPMVAYLIQIEGVRVLYVSNCESELTEAQVEEFGRVDVVIFAANDPKLGVKLVEAVEPTFVVPIGEAEMVQAFVKSYERGSREVASLSVNLATMPSDLTEVVVLTV